MGKQKATDAERGIDQGERTERDRWAAEAPLPRTYVRDGDLAERDSGDETRFDPHQHRDQFDRGNK